jgi:hypothetical protein
MLTKLFCHHCKREIDTDSDGWTYYYISESLPPISFHTECYEMSVLVLNIKLGDEI